MARMRLYGTDLHPEKEYATALDNNMETVMTDHPKLYAKEKARIEKALKKAKLTKVAEKTDENDIRYAVYEGDVGQMDVFAYMAGSTSYMDYRNDEATTVNARLENHMPTGEKVVAKFSYSDRGESKEARVFAARSGYGICREFKSDGLFAKTCWLDSNVYKTSSDAEKALCSDLNEWSRTAGTVKKMEMEREK